MEDTNYNIKHGANEETTSNNKKIKNIKNEVCVYKAGGDDNTSLRPKPELNSVILSTIKDYGDLLRLNGRTESTVHSVTKRLELLACL